MNNDREESAPLPHPTRRNWLWVLLHIVLGTFFIAWFRFRARGVQHIPRTGGGLVLANHQSYLDPMMIGLPLARPISYMGRDTLFKVPGLAWILRMTYVFPISRSAASAGSLRNALARMHHGFLVGVFPEGTRTTDGRMQPFKPGIISLLRRCDLPVYPVGVAGADRAMPRGSIFPRMRKIRVVFGPPILPAEYEPLLEKGQEQNLLQLAFDRVHACQIAAENWRSGHPDFASDKEQEAP